MQALKHRSGKRITRVNLSLIFIFAVFSACVVLVPNYRLHRFSQYALSYNQRDLAMKSLSTPKQYEQEHEEVWRRVKPHPNPADTKKFLTNQSYSVMSVQARLIVLTMNRDVSLRRLLKSIARARYHGARIDVDIWIDRQFANKPANARVLETALSFQWPHGIKRVHIRRKPGGLYQQWLWTWNITENTKEFAVILEDDLELSAAWFEWLVEARRRYGDDEEVAGFTLQRLTIRAAAAKGFSGLLTFPKGTSAFKYKLQGSWGFAPKPEIWMEFRMWFEDMVRNGKNPYVPGLITTNWYRAQERKPLGYAPTMWTQWFVKFSDERGYFTVTPHLLDGTTLSANHKERGLHFHSKKSRKDYPVYRGTSDGFAWPKVLLRFDWNGSILNEDE